MLYCHISNPFTIVMILPIPSLLAHQSNTALSDGEVYMSLGEIVTTSLISGARLCNIYETSEEDNVHYHLTNALFCYEECCEDWICNPVVWQWYTHQSHWVMEKRETLRIKGDFGRASIFMHSASVVTYYVRVPLFHDILLRGPMAVTFRGLAT